MVKKASNLRYGTNYF